MRRRSTAYLLAAIMVIGLFTRLNDIKEPWTGLKDFTGALHSQIAENYLRFGYLRTGLGPTTNFEENPEHFTYYLHHPVLFNIILSLPMNVLGTSEWVARLVSIMFSTMGVLLVFLLIRNLWNERTGLFGAFFMAFMPMSVYFGRMVNEETLAVPIIVLLVTIYTSKYRAGDSSRLPPVFFITMFIGLLTAWPIYYCAGFIFLHLLFSGKKSKRDITGILVLGTLVIFAAVLFLAHGKYLTGHWGGNLITIFLERSGAVSQLMEGGSAMKTLPRWFVVFFTPVTLALSIWYVIACLIGRAKIPTGGGLALIILFLVAATHVVLFREAALRHEYWLYYFTAPLAVSSAAGLEFLESRISRQWSRTAVTSTVLVIFFALSLMRLDALFAISKFRNIPDLGKWIRTTTGEDAKLLVIGPDLTRFGYSPRHFDYYDGPIYTWPMPHLGYYARRRIRWGIRDIEELETLISNPGNLTYALMTREYWDPLVTASYEFLRNRRREIAPEEWGKDDSVPIRLFDLRETVSMDTSSCGGNDETIRRHARLQ